MTDWVAVDELAFALVDVDLYGVPGAVALDLAHSATRDEMTSVLLDSEQ